MKALFLTLAALIAVSALAAGIASASAKHTSAAGGTTVAAANSKLGRILVDGRGRTLYLFGKDARGKSACAGACAAFWPPLIASGKPVAKSGAKSSLLGTIKRRDGRLQITYNHHPLYTFVKDTAKGQTNGEGVSAYGAEWYALSSTGAKLESNAGTGYGSAPAPGGYGY